jgi:hypothetical protein
MGTPTVASGGFTTRVKRWLLAELAKHLDGSYVLGDDEEQPPCESSDGARTPTQESMAVARGVIRHEEVPLLARYGTSYGLFDEWSAYYQCVLISDVYDLGAYVGDSVWVSGSLTAVIGGMPLMKVTHMELLRLKWMR